MSLNRLIMTVLITLMIVLILEMKTINTRLLDTRADIHELSMDIKDMGGVHQEVIDQENIKKYGRYHRAPVQRVGMEVK